MNDKNFNFYELEKALLLKPGVGMIQDLVG